MNKFMTGNVADLVLAFKSLGIKAQIGGDKYQNKTLGIIRNEYPEECNSFHEVAIYMVEKVFAGHTLNRIFISHLSDTSRSIIYCAIVDNKDWSLRHCFGWDTVPPFMDEWDYEHLSHEPKYRDMAKHSAVLRFINESNSEFTDISSESVRTYNFGQKGFVKIQNPMYLNVSPSGAHRLFSADGQSHYIPNGWVQLSWTVREGEPNFVK